jgi:hypothetical protein
MANCRRRQRNSRNRQQPPPAIAVLAVKVKPLRAALALGLQVALLSESGPRAAFRQQRDLKASCRAGPAQSSRSDRSAAQERRSRLTAPGRRGRRRVGMK